MEEKKEVIEEIKREESLNHVKVLKALMHIPFPVGKNLLADYLAGNSKNKSVLKNGLNEKFSFGSLKIEKSEIHSIIDNLISNGLIESVPADFNKFIKVLKITKKGQDEILNPCLQEKKLKNNFNFGKTEITDKDKEVFEELDFFLNGFNEEQKKAIVSDKEDILCIAGAGSGKTTVLTKRIEFLVKFKGINPSKILAITFTRKAREEMARRLSSKGILVHVHTFNSLAEKILNKHSMKIYGRKVRVMNYTDKMMAISSALDSLHMTMEGVIEKYFSEGQKSNKTKEHLQAIFVNDCFSLLDYFKSKKMEIYDFSEEADPKNYEIAKIIYKITSHIKEYMELHGLRDYTDQVLDVLGFFKKYPHLSPSFDHILIDEYQDVNSMQIEFIDSLKFLNLFAVGDPRQSIFGWRGSDINYILNFKEKYPDSEVISLTKNYRSSKRIVELMNISISEMSLPNLEHHSGEESKIKMTNFDAEEEEFEFVINKILSSNIPREEIFVLARTNRQLNEISKVFRNRGIPHIVKSENYSRQVNAKEGEVTLATIHSIKGLEAKTVFVIGCNESNFPCKASDHPVLELVKINEYDKEEEEKRLFYVAISRAKEELYLTYSGKNHTYFIKDEMKNLSE